MWQSPYLEKKETQDQSNWAILKTISKETKKMCLNILGYQSEKFKKSQLGTMDGVWKNYHFYFYFYFYLFFFFISILFIFFLSNNLNQFIHSKNKKRNRIIMVSWQSCCSCRRFEKWLFLFEWRMDRIKNRIGKNNWSFTKRWSIVFTIVILWSHCLHFGHVHTYI